MSITFEIGNEVADDRGRGKWFSVNVIRIGPSMLRAPAEQTKVATVLHIFPFLFLFSCYHRYSKPQKGLSYCFKFLHGPLKKNNKNLGKNFF